MRISDWSSDVCSSDLIVIGVIRRHRGAAPAAFVVGGLIGAARLLAVAIEATLFDIDVPPAPLLRGIRSEEHTSAIPSLMRKPYAVFCLKKTNNTSTIPSSAPPLTNTPPSTHITSTL